MKRLALILTFCVSAILASAQTIEPIKYGDFESWTTREIAESAIIGGNTKLLYVVGPEGYIKGNIPYDYKANTPWTMSNAYAKWLVFTKEATRYNPKLVATADVLAWTPKWKM